MLVSIAILASACTHSQTAKPSAATPATPKVSFANDVHPLLMKSCAQCHARGKSEGDFSIESRESVLKGGGSGPAVIPGKSAESYLIKLVTVGEGSKVMPMKGPRLTEAEVATLRAWIDAGVPWEMTKETKQAKLAPLPPRKPETPAAGKREANPIDAFLAAYFKEHHVKPSKPVEDALFARRVYLDSVGLIPPAKDLSEFLADRHRDKRERLVDKLLADKRAYAEHWISFWNDMLRNDFTGTGYIDGGRKQITSWLYGSLASNEPFDKFVRELINPTNASSGFINGIVWRGVTNASQTPSMQAAQNVSQVFMGTNLKCASCHDSFINQWKLKDSYGLASIFTEEPLAVVRCDRPTGDMAQMHFIYPELGEIDPKLPKAERLARLAEVMTKRDNGRLARTMVNRLWARFFGRGLVEPIDDMDQSPWNADLLDWLAWDFADSGFDLKHTMKVIFTSKAYQMPAVSLGENKTAEFVFTGPAVRRLTAEEFLDAFGRVTGIWQKEASARIDFSASDPAQQVDKAEIAKALAAAKWIWADAGADKDAPKETVYFRKVFDLPELKSGQPLDATIFTACDNQFTLYVNGNKVSEGKDWNRPVAAVIGKLLTAGHNVIAIAGTNTVAGPAGLIVYAKIRRGAEKFDFTSDGSWLATKMKLKEWEKPNFIPLEWGPAAEIGNLDAAPWNITDALTESVRFDAGANNRTIRAWLAKSDSFMRTLGRPNRDQVVTVRPSVATTLESLELTNGPTLSGKLKEAAGQILEKESSDPRAVASKLYFEALGRKPTRKEMKIATGMLGSPASKEGVEDLLWTVLMLPDFQLIY